MQNPFFRAKLVDGTKLDINLTQVAYVTEAEAGSNVTFANGTVLTVQESAQTIRGRTRKTWPAEAGEEVTEA